MQPTLQFLNALYPQPFADLAGASLAIWTRTRDGKSQTHWTDGVEAAAEVAGEHRESRDVYFGVALQNRERALELARRRRPDVPARAVRGKAESAAVLPGIWVDLDIADGHHRSAQLPPDRAAALGLLTAVPHPPTLLVASGGGYHAYWLFPEPWILATRVQHASAAALVLRLQWTIRQRAAERGWSVDHTADLARVLRLPGTLNHKGPRPRPVELEALTDRRYQPSHFECLPDPVRPRAAARRRRQPRRRDRPPPHGTRPLRAARLGVGPCGSDSGRRPAKARPVFLGCSWLRHCYQQRQRLSEPEWYAALSIVGRCASRNADGRELAHRISRGHPGYSAAETDAKLDHALEDSGPRTCRHIAQNLGAFEAHCGRCPHFGRIKSPIVLGRGGRGEAVQEEIPPLTPPFPKGENLAGAKFPEPRLEHEPNFPPLKKGGLRGDFSAGGGGPDDGNDGDGGAAPPAPPPIPPGDPSQSPPSKRPQRERVPINHFENEVADRALTILVRREPNLFERGGSLVQVAADDADHDSPFHRPPDAPAALPIQEARLREILTTHCEFVRPQTQGRGVAWRPVHPPPWIARALLDRFRWPGIRRLEGVVEGPVLRPDGSVLQEPGYDRPSGLYYAPGVTFEAIPERPRVDQVGAALELLREAVCDFPFQDPAHFSGWLSSLLTPLARFAFKGPSPLNLIDANIRGAGKSLLADVGHVIVSGRPAPRMAYLRDEAELRKVITTLALKARQMVLFDNVSGAFGSPTLDLALTSTTWEDRLLGQNAGVELPLLVTWFATGNNIDLRGDLARRCVHIRLESPEEKPERRSGFQHPRLLDWLQGQRPHLLPAALTLLVAYCDAGRPGQGLRPWGSYESWSDLVRGAVVWLGLPDPADTVDSLESAADIETLAAANLVEGLAALCESMGGGATAGEILRRLDDDRDDGCFKTVSAALEEMYPRLRPGELPTTVQLGNKLRGLRGRNFGGRRVRGRKSKEGMVWRIDPGSDEPTSATT